MKANQLRVGNYIMDNNNFIMQVSLIDSFNDTIYCDFEGNTGDLFEFDINNPPKPIPLTIELLLKCKYHLLTSRYYVSFIKFDKYLIGQDKENDYFAIYNELYYSNTFKVAITTFKYLHQYQNIISALTDQELIINL